MAKKYTRGGAERLCPDIVEATPMHSINSTAYACKIEYKFEDSLHSSIVVAFREDGDPVPTNMEEVKNQIDLGLIDIEPHFSMEWANKKVQTPSASPYNLIATEDNIEELVL